MAPACLAAVLAAAPLPLLSPAQARLPARHTRHWEVYGGGVPAANRAVLQAIDLIQAKAPGGGGYFADPAARPLESPLGQPLSLWGRPLFKPQRSTSFCSGATYGALVGALNILFPDPPPLPDEALESLRQTEADGSRRENQSGFWGVWNGEGAGLEHALVTLGKMGRRVPPREAKAGDFIHIYWKNGLGHSAVFLGWTKPRGLRIWSSQKATNGLGDWTVPRSRAKSVVVVRLTHPEAVVRLKSGFFAFGRQAGDRLP